MSRTPLGAGWRAVRGRLRAPRRRPPERAAPESRFDHLLGHLRGMVVDFDDRGRVVYVSPNVSDVFGFDVDPRDATRTRNGFDRVHPDDRAELRTFARKLRETGQPGRFLYRARHSDGRWLWLETSSVGTYRDDGVLHTVVFTRDVTDVQHARDALRESEERFRAIARNASDLISEIDGAGRFLYVSANCAAILGRTPDELIGKTLRDSGIAECIHPDDREEVTRGFERGIASGGNGGEIAYRYRHADGSWRWFESQARTYRDRQGEVRAVVISRDVTRRVLAEREVRALEDRLRQSEKLESLGVMAGGIAHDFNNLLTPILSDTALALMELPEGLPARAYVERIQRSARRLASLTQEIVAVTGKAHRLCESLDLSELVLRVRPRLEDALGKRAALDLRLDRPLPPIDGDPHQLEHVLVEMVENAREALPEAGGHVTLATGVRELRCDEIARLSPRGAIAEGRYVQVEVRDDGCGMNAATQSRIFDPFYTTRMAGRGLGLAAALGIARAHGGAIAVESEPGHGTCVRMHLPARGAPEA